MPGDIIDLRMGDIVQSDAKLLELTQITGTLLAVYSVLVTPIGWLNAGIVWGYALVWFLILHGIKMLAFKMQQINSGKQEDEKTTHQK